MIYEFPAVLTLPVADDTEDTIPVAVTARVDRCEDGSVSFDLDATVTVDAPNDFKVPVYRRGDTISFENFGTENYDRIEAAYLANAEWDRPDFMMDASQAYYRMAA